MEIESREFGTGCVMQVLVEVGLMAKSENPNGVGFGEIFDEEICMAQNDLF